MLPVTPIGVEVAVAVAVMVALMAVAVAVAVAGMMVGTIVAVGVAVVFVAVAVGVGLEPATFKANVMLAQVPLLIAPGSEAMTPAAPRAVSDAPSAKRVPLRNGTRTREFKLLGSVRLLLPPLMNPTYSSLLKLVLKEHRVGVVPLP